MNPLAQILFESGCIPDPVIRFFIRRRLGQKLREEHARKNSAAADMLHALSEGPIAVHTQEANTQHYELPAGFFEAILGPHLKYSSGYWPEGVSTLGASEEAMLELYVERARLKDGQDILELGCGWGSLCLYLAKKFSASRILAVSNSASQRQFIEGRAKEAGLKNLVVRTADINELTLEKKFDRIVSIEMFEHMRNYKKLLALAASWLKPEGLLFVHIFCHREYTWFFDPAGPDDWMGRYFFTGGLMPSWNLLATFKENLTLLEKWRIDGRHYEKTSNAWLARMDQSRESLRPFLESTYGKNAGRWWIYWRVFFMACAELFGYKQGSEWFVGHYLLEKKAP